jgi:hypothetical protein
MEDMQGQVPMLYTQPEAAGSFDHSHQKLSATQETQHPQPRTPKYKEKSEHVKCVLCNGNHPANYKGCTVYKEIQKRTFPPLRNKLDGKTLAVQPQPYTRPGTSYCAALTSQQQYETTTSIIQQIPTRQQQIHPQTSEIHELKTMMKGLMEQMSTMLNLLTTVVSKMI